MYLCVGRVVHSIVDRTLLCIPGLRTLAHVLCCDAPGRGGCISLLCEGHMVGVAPGGGRQAMLGLDWGDRRGYAIAADTARVPVIVMYTENINLAYTTTTFSWPVSYILYLSTRIAVAPVYGGLPVQLTSKLSRVTAHVVDDGEDIMEHIDDNGEREHRKDILNKAVVAAMTGLQNDKQCRDETHAQALRRWISQDVDLSQARL